MFDFNVYDVLNGENNECLQCTCGSSVSATLNVGSTSCNEDENIRYIDTMNKTADCLLMSADNSTVGKTNEKRSVKGVENISADHMLYTAYGGTRKGKGTTKQNTSCMLTTAYDSRGKGNSEEIICNNNDDFKLYNNVNKNDFNNDIPNVLDTNGENDTERNISNDSNASDVNNESSSESDQLFSSLKEARLNNPKSLIFTHININSLKKEQKAPVDYFKDMLLRGFMDILCVSETKLNSSIVEKDLDCSPKYKVYRKDKSSTSGGLCLWIRSDVPQQRLQHLEFDSVNYHIESMIFELKVRKETWFLIFAYKNPNVPKHIFINKLKHVYEELIHKGQEVLTIGDFNIDCLHAENEIKHGICDVYGLQNIVSEPTCFKTPEGTLVDIILVKNSKRFKKPINVFCGYSDWHHLIGCITKLHIPPPKPNKVTYRSFKNFDETLFKSEVQCIPFHICNIFDDINDQYWVRNTLFTQVLNEHAPLKQKALREEHVPYMNSTLSKEMYRRNMLKNKHLADRKNDIKRFGYTKQRNKVTDMRRIAIKEYFMSKCKPGASPRDFWNAIGPFLSSKSKSHRNIILKEEETIVTSTSELCEIFINFFSTAANSIGCPDEIDMNQSDFLTKITDKHKNHSSILAIKERHKDKMIFDFNPVHPDYVKNILKKLNVNKSTGYDAIPPKVVRLCSEELSVTLTELINEGFRCKTFPEDLKKAEISPIFKKKDDMLKDNYRPVSILAIFSKVYETIIANQLMDFFKHIFDNMLCAYRKKYGTQHVLVKLVDAWKCALDENKFAGTVLMDLSKAFDCIPHGLLITKLYTYGLSSNACEFMSSYLSGRHQRVRISNERSTWMPLLKGVPQGSCLGPLLFNVFMNDIFYLIESCELVNYADDNTLSAVSNSIEMVISALRNDSEKAIKWFVDNFMKVNPSKFQFMFIKPIICRYETPQFIEINDTKVQCESEVKLLGITIDERLKFDRHVDILCKKAAKQLNVMYRFKNIFNSKEKGVMYNTFILSNFNYCPIIWHFCGKTSTKKIEAIQERALRFMYNDKESTYDSLLKKCQCNTLHIRRIMTIATEVFKSLNHLNPIFMKDSFHQKDINYNLRDANVLSQPKFNKITYGKNTFKYYGSHVWNLLPNEVKLCTDIESFKSLLKTWEGPKCQCNMCNALT